MELFLKVMLFIYALYIFQSLLNFYIDDKTKKNIIIGVVILVIFAYSYHKSTNKYKDILLNDYCLVEKDNYLIIDRDCDDSLYIYEDTPISNIKYNLIDNSAEIELRDILKYYNKNLGVIDEYNLKYNYISDSYEIKFYSYNDETDTGYDISCSQKDMNCPANVEYLLGQINGDIHHLLVPYKLIQKLDTKPFWEGF